MPVQYSCSASETSFADPEEGDPLSATTASFRRNHLPIPEFDPTQELAAAAEKDSRNSEQRGDSLNVTITRPELRKWLRDSTEGKPENSGRKLAGG